MMNSLIQRPSTKCHYDWMGARIAMNRCIDVDEKNGSSTQGGIYWYNIASDVNPHRMETEYFTGRITHLQEASVARVRTIW